MRIEGNPLLTPSDQPTSTLLHRTVQRWRRRGELRSSRQILTVMWALQATGDVGVFAADVTRLTGLRTSTAMLVLETLVATGHATRTSVVPAGSRVPPRALFRITERGGPYAVELCQQMLTVSPGRPQGQGTQ